MQYTRLSLPDVVLLTPRVFEDERGFFFESFRQSEFEQHCGSYQFVQENHSRSTKGILRGLHYQSKHTQGKLVKVIQGEVFDVSVDMRRNSPTFGQWVGLTLNSQQKNQLWIPPGFAHGFYVTSEFAELQYKCTDYYAPQFEHSLLWNDPELAITWPLDPLQSPVLSVKDVEAKPFRQSPALE